MILFLQFNQILWTDAAVEIALLRLKPSVVDDPLQLVRPKSTTTVVKLLVSRRRD